VKEEILINGLIELFCFTVVGARCLLNEPKIYGPMRLIEVTQRLVEFAESIGIHHEVLKELGRRIGAFSLESLDTSPEREGEFAEFLDTLIDFLASSIKHMKKTGTNDV